VAYRSADETPVAASLTQDFFFLVTEDMASAILDYIGTRPVLKLADIYLRVVPYKIGGRTKYAAAILKIEFTDSPSFDIKRGYGKATVLKTITGNWKLP
jgi:hypothetical protein